MRAAASVGCRPASTEALHRSNRGLPAARRPEGDPEAPNRGSGSSPITRLFRGLRKQKKGDTTEVHIGVSDLTVAAFGPGKKAFATASERPFQGD